MNAEISARFALMAKSSVERLISGVFSFNSMSFPAQTIEIMNIFAVTRSNKRSCGATGISCFFPEKIPGVLVLRANYERRNFGVFLFNRPTRAIFYYSALFVTDFTI